MDARFALSLILSVIITLASRPVLAGTDHTYVNNNSPTVAGDLQTGQTSDYWWANSFDAALGGEYITRVDVSFANLMTAGTPVSIAIYNDPSNSNNPDDLQLLAQMSGAVGSTGSTDLFLPQAFDFSTPVHVTGDFFVAMEANNIAKTGGIPVTSANPVGRGFLAYNGASNAGTMTLTNIYSADQPPASVDSVVGAAQPTYNLFIGARGRLTRYAEAQDPLLFDGFNTGDFSITANGIQVDASDAIGGNRIAVIAAPNGPGSVSVADGDLTLTNCQATIAYGGQYFSGSGYQTGYNSYMHANAGGYDFMQFHFLQANSIVQFENASGSITNYTTDADGNVDFNIAGDDWTDLNTYSFTLYSYNKTTSLDSITLITNPIPGDVNGDGVVNADDYAALTLGFAAHLSGHVNGDLNGDGVVNEADYLILDTAFGKQNGLSQDMLAARQSQFGDAYVSELQSLVPEPGDLAICLLALPALIQRRRA